MFSESAIFVKYPSKNAIICLIYARKQAEPYILLGKNQFLPLVATLIYTGIRPTRTLYMGMWGGGGGT